MSVDPTTDQESATTSSTLLNGKVIEEDDYSRVWDVIIVGAGLSGLSAAQVLNKDGGKKSFLILESQDRVGGRTLDETTPAGGSIVEMGGQWISPGHVEIQKLAKELQIATFNVYDEGKSIYHKDGRNVFYKDVIPCGILAKLDLWLTTKKLNRLARNIPASYPWKGKDAIKYDQQSIGSWVEGNMRTREGKLLLNVAVQAVYGESGQMISLLDLLSSITGAGGDINTLLDDAQSMRFVYGPQNLSRRIAEQFNGNTIRLNETVRLVKSLGKKELDGSNILLQINTDECTYRCKAIVLTMPRIVLGKIRFEPALPTKLTQLLQHQPMGSVIKINVIYSCPFWRKAGLSGAVVCSDIDSPIQITYDNSPPPGTGSEGVLVTFMSGHQGRNHFDKPIEDRRRWVLDKLVAFFGQEANEPIAYHDKVWAADEMALGAYGSYNPPGVLTAFQGATQVTQIGNIYFAGDGTSETWQGYMEGAICSGQKVARNVMQNA